MVLRWESSVCMFRPISTYVNLYLLTFPLFLFYTHVNMAFDGKFLKCLMEMKLKELRGKNAELKNCLELTQTDVHELKN